MSFCQHLVLKDPFKSSFSLNPILPVTQGAGKTFLDLLQPLCCFKHSSCPMVFQLHSVFVPVKPNRASLSPVSLSIAVFLCNMYDAILIVSGTKYFYKMY